MTDWQSPEALRQEGLPLVPHVDLIRDITYLSAKLEPLGTLVHRCNQKWWLTPEGAPRERNVGEMLMLAVSELSEAMEGHRKSLPDDKLPHRPMLEVELADALIRILDTAQGLGLDLAGAFREKMIFNLTREDHSLAARQAPGGKKY